MVALSSHLLSLLISSRATCYEVMLELLCSGVDHALVATKALVNLSVLAAGHHTLPVAILAKLYTLEGWLHPRVLLADVPLDLGALPQV